MKSPLGKMWSMKTYSGKNAYPADFATWFRRMSPPLG